MGIIFGRGADKLLHQYVIDLFGFHAFKRQMQMPNRLPHRGRVQSRTPRQEIADEVLGILVDASGVNRNMAAAINPLLNQPKLQKHYTK